LSEELGKMPTAQDTRTINLKGSLGVDHAGEIARELSEAIAACRSVLVGLSLVEDMDLSCLQVLYAAKALAAAQGKELHFLGSVPSRVARRLSTCGFLRGAPERAEAFESALVGF
jgi:anti-anti-sigma factor